MNERSDKRLLTAGKLQKIRSWVEEARKRQRLGFSDGDAILGRQWCEQLLAHIEAIEARSPEESNSATSVMGVA